MLLIKARDVEPRSVKEEVARQMGKVSGFVFQLFLFLSSPLSIMKSSHLSAGIFLVGLFLLFLVGNTA